MRRSFDWWVLCLRGWLTIPRPAARATLVRTAWTRLEAPCPLDCRRPETSRCSSQGRTCCTFGEMWTRRWLASIPGGGSCSPGRATAPQRLVAPSCPLRTCYPAPRLRACLLHGFKDYAVQDGNGVSNWFYTQRCDLGDQEKMRPLGTLGERDRCASGQAQQQSSDRAEVPWTVA